MTAERDLDPITRAWLDLMPDEVPDRVIDAVLTTVESTPQQRLGRLAGPTRSLPMNRLLLVAAAVGLGAVVLGGVLVAGGRDAHPVPSQAALATASATLATPQPTMAELPAALRYRWIGPPRAIGTRGESTRTGLNITDGFICMTGTTYGYSCPLLKSDATIVAPGRLRLITHGDGTGSECGAGEAGDYPYTLSPGGTALVVGPGTDACAARLAGVTGTWHRDACMNVSDGCWGVLEAATYPSQYFVPRRDPGADWEPDLGAVTFTVPDGWANAADWPNNFTLMPADEYAREPDGNPPDGIYEEVDLLAQPKAAVQDDTCRGAVDPRVDRSVQGLAAWITSLPSLDVTPPRPVTVDGHHGVQMDIRLAAGWTKTCGGAAPKVQFLAREEDHGEAYELPIIAGERERLTLVDLGGGDVLAIVVDSGDPARFDALAAGAQSIIDSLHIR